MVLLSDRVLFNTLVFITIVFVIFYLYFKYRFTYWKKLGVPYLKPHFPFGNFEESVRALRPIGLIVTDYYNAMKAKGHKFFGVYIFQNPAIITVDPDLVKSVMSRDFAHFYDRGVYHDEENDPLTATLFSLEGQKWRNLRAKLTPTFTSGKMKKMFQTLVDCSLELRDCLNEPIRKSEPVDIKQVLVQYTTDVIGSCAFGIECNSFKNPNTEFIKSGRKIFFPEGLQRIKFFTAMLIPKFFKFFKLKVTDKDVDQFYRNLVKETIEYREKNNISRNDFMQLLIQLKNKGIVEYEANDHEHEKEHKDHKDIDFKFTLNSLSAQAFIFFIAGFETSSTTMAWTLFELAQNPEIQGKLREEIIRVLKKHDGKITYDVIMDMHYMDRVVQESLRKYPPVMMLQRKVTSDYKVPDTDIVWKKGTTVFIPNYAIQNDPEYYPNPEKFDPDRFTEENKCTRPDFTWLPFGEGPRICIGLRFGLMQVKVGLTQLLLNYNFTLNAKTINPPIFDPHSFVASAIGSIWLNAEKNVH